MGKSMMCLAAMPAMPLMAMARMWSCESKTAAAETAHRGRPSDAQAWACAEAKPQTAAKGVVETAQAAGAFGTLLKALSVTGLDAALAGKGPFTVFAPSDEAFAKLPKGALQGLLDKPAELAEVLKLHVVGARLTSAELGGVGSLRTLGGQSLGVDTSLGVKVGTAHVIKADIVCGNGVIHVIDSVLLPA